jgi:uncharacterized membrane protein
MLATVAGAITAFAFSRFGWAPAIVASWNAISATELALAWSILWTSGPAETRRQAESRQRGRTTELFFVVSMCVIALLLSIVLLRRAETVAPSAPRALGALCVAAVVGAWVLVHTTFTASYARRYYHGGGGLSFPGDDQPDYFDFAYFAFTVGMCFQVSDVAVTEHRLRRFVTAHAIVSFAFNTGILALALNLVASLKG